MASVKDVKADAKAGSKQKAAARWSSGSYRKRNLSPDLKRALVALPTQNVMCFLSRVPPGSIASSDVSECQELCKALAGAVEQERARCCASASAGQGLPESRCVLILVGSPGAPADPSMPFEPYRPESGEQDEDTADAANAGKANSNGNVVEEEADSNLSRGDGATDKMETSDDVSDGDNGGEEIIVGEKVEIDPLDMVAQTANHLREESDLMVQGLSCAADDAVAWSAQLSRRGVVLVADATTSLAAFRRGSLSLERVHMLVYDAADRARDLQDPVRAMLRDSLPSIVPERRPRVLGLSRALLKEPADLAAIEAALGVRYLGVFGFASRVNADAPRILIEATAAAPSEAPLVNLQTLYYPQHGAGGSSAPLGEVGRVAAEVGSLGVSLYQRRVTMRRLRRKWRKIELARARGVGDSAGEQDGKKLAEYLIDKVVASYEPGESIIGRDLLLGVAPKALLLLDFLHTECATMLSEQACETHPGAVFAVQDQPVANDPEAKGRKSPQSSQDLSFSRQIIVNAGAPTVAAALCELVRQLPGFTGVKTSVVMGDANAAQSFERSADEDGKKMEGWQGAETDDDAINAFLVGEVNILFVASDNIAKIERDRRPYPIGGLVVCYDGKSIDVLRNGATNARTRVVVFAPATEARRSVAEVGGDRAGKDSIALRTGVHLRQSPSGVNSMENGPSAGGGSTYSPNDSVVASPQNYDDVVGERIQFNFKIRPPPALLGPDDDGGNMCYMYTVEPVVASDTLLKNDSSLSSDRTGVSSFAIVLTEELSTHDLVMHSGTDGAALGLDSFGDGSLVLKCVGNAVLSSEQVQVGRKYTSFLFGAASKRHDAQMFQWGKSAVKNGDSTRRYLVLPLESRSSGSNETGQVPVECAESPRTCQDCMAVYFEHTSGERSTTAPGDTLGSAAELTNATARSSFSDESAPDDLCVDWHAVHSIVSSLEKAQAAKRDDRVPVKSSVDGPQSCSIGRYSHLEGTIVCAGYDPKKRPYVTAKLDWSRSPLLRFVRQKRFDLLPNGNLCNWEQVQKEVIADQVELASLVPGAEFATEDSSRTGAQLMAEATKASRKRGRQESNLSDGNSEDFEESDLSDHGDRQTQKSPSDANANRTSAPVARDEIVGKQKFNAARNKQKRRKVWYGPVLSTYEGQLSESRDVVCRDRHQPLLSAVQPDFLPMAAFWRVASGTSMSMITEEFFQAEVEVNPESGLKLVPEFMTPYAIPVSALLLPPVLLRMERHLTSCAFRSLFDDKVDRVLDVPRLTCALTSSSVSASENYERLELLGDAILKLGSTIRLIVKYPHYAEGDMHPLRCSIVSNNALNKKAVEAGIEHYLNFTKTHLSDWNPPGYDMDAKPVPVHDKALADVVEAVAGAFYMQGAADYAEGKSPGEPSQPKDPAPTPDAEASCAEVANPADPVAQTSSLAHSIVHGYVSGTKFLEAIGALDTKEPSHEEVLRAAIHAMHRPSIKAPVELKPSSFPVDERMTHPKKPWGEHLGLVEKELGYKFKYRQLLFCALTHQSYAEQIRNGRQLLSKFQTFQRLEFLGDAAVDFCMARYLFDRYPNQGPGDLTELKSAVVSNEAFARVSVDRNFHRFLYTKSRAMRGEVEKFVRACKAENERRDQGDTTEWWSREREAPKVLGDIFEAIVGAIFVDSGLPAVWNVCMRLLGPTLRERADPSTFATHPVKLFQDYVTKEQRLSSLAPLYYVPETKTTGTRFIRATVSVHKKTIFSGEGSTKKRAMCMAAQGALERLKAAQRPGSKDAEFLQSLRLLGDKERAEQMKQKRHY